MNKLSVGTIIKLTDQTEFSEWAVVVDISYYLGELDRVRKVALEHDAFTRILSNDASCGYYFGAMESNGGWWVDSDVYTYEIIPEDQIPDEIIVLAMRCLLDRTFIPFVSEGNKV